MKLSIKSKIRRYITNLRLKKDKRISVGYNTYLRDGFNWDIRETPEKSPCISIGENCIIGGNLVIENSRGIICIGNACTLGGDSLVVAGDAGVYIGTHCVISFNVTMYTTNSHSLDVEERHKDLYNTLDYLHGKIPSRGINWAKIISKDIVIEDDVWIGFGATILKGVRVGKGAIIGAKSVVTHDVEPYTVVVGNPAQVVKRLK